MKKNYAKTMAALLAGHRLSFWRRSICQSRFEKGRRARSVDSPFLTLRLRPSRQRQPDPARVVKNPQSVSHPLHPWYAKFVLKRAKIPPISFGCITSLCLVHHIEPRGSIQLPRQHDRKNKHVTTIRLECLGRGLLDSVVARVFFPRH